MKKALVVSIVLVLAVVALFFIFNTNDVSGTPVTVYKSPTCGCCVGYIAELKRSGFDVNVITTDDMGSIKSRYNIPHEMQSCHTTIMGDYFIEGHTPLSALNKLTSENPNIDGISLPGMPSGSPGMPGMKNKEWTIYSLSDGEYSEFMRI